MAIIKRKGRKNYYSVFWLNGKQKWISTGTDDKEIATSIDAHLQVAQKGNVSTERIVKAVKELMNHQEQTQLLLNSCWETYLSLRSVKLGKETQRKRRLSWNRMLHFVNLNFPRVKYLHEIDRHIAFAYTDYLFGSVNKGKTFNNHRGDLVTILNKLTYRAGLNENVFSLTEAANTDDSVSGRAFTELEIENILKIATGEYYGAALIALYTGLRFSDLAFLEWSEIEEDQFNLLPEKTKKHKTRVIVPFHERISDYFSSFKKSDNRWVFPDLQTSYGYGSRRSKFTTILKLAGINTNKTNVDSIVTFHSFRHTFATRLAEAGISQEIRMKLGGWKNENIAEIYNHDTTALEHAINQLK